MGDAVHCFPVNGLAHVCMAPGWDAAGMMQQDGSVRHDLDLHTDAQMSIICAFVCMSKS